MRLPVLALLCAGLLAALALPARAAFEDIEVSPRSRALGEAGAAAAFDTYAALHNPAALAWSADVAGAGSYLEPFSLPFTSQSTVAAALPLPGSAGGVGLAVRTFGVSWQGADLQDETTLSIAHGFRLLHDATSELAVGWSVSFYSLSFGTSVTGLDPGRASTIGVGLGALAVVRERTRVGFAIENANNPSIGDRDHQDLNHRVRAGVAYSPYAGVTTLVAMNADLGSEFEYRGGVEFEVTNFLWLRAGVRTEPNTFTAGLGVQVRGIHLDYGFSSGGGVLDDSHHVGIEMHARPPWGRQP